MPIINGIFDQFTEVCTFQLDDVKKILINKDIIVMTSMILAMSDHQPRKSGLRIKVDGKMRRNTISIQTVKSNFRMFCSSNAWQKRKKNRLRMYLLTKQTIQCMYLCVCACIYLLLVFLCGHVKDDQRTCLHTSAINSSIGHPRQKAEIARIMSTINLVIKKKER